MFLYTPPPPSRNDRQTLCQAALTLLGTCVCRPSGELLCSQTNAFRHTQHYEHVSGKGLGGTDQNPGGVNSQPKHKGKKFSSRALLKKSNVML